jgi:methyltransferase (TIGR00027 family)
MVVPIGRPRGVTARTRIVDAEVALAVGRGITQIVLLGAGYDGRALRFGGRAVRWFEVDLPSTQADKRRRLAALGIEPAGVDYAGVDLMSGDLGGALEGAGHDPAAPSLFVCERVLASLTLEATASVCQTLRARAAPASVLLGSFLVAAAPSAPLRALRLATDACLSALGEPRRGELRPGDPEKLMVVTGWNVTHAESSAGGRFDPGSHPLVLVCEPGPLRPG